jgi:RimJ/RimL family protein N-acetyltransferase
MNVIETNRIQLRKLALSDTDSLAEIFADTETMQYYSSTKSKEQTTQWIKWNIENYTKHGFGLWAVILKQTNTFIGDCGITLQNIDDEMKHEIGYHIHKKHWNQNIATESAIACRDYAFQVLELNEIFVKTNIRNLASRKVAEKTGMSFRKTYLSKSRPGELSCFYSITKEEWLKTV